MWILCVCSNLVKYVVVVVVEEFMINWCCCCYEMCVVVNSCYGYSWLWNLWWNLSCFENFMKNGWIGNLWWNDVFESSFIWIWVSFYVYKRLDKLSRWIWALGNQKLGFLGENGVFHESRIFENCQNSPLRVGGEFCLCELAMASEMLAMASCTVTTFIVSSSCVFCTHLCFKLAFGVNMKVLDNWVGFPMALVWLENVLWILSYVKNTPSRSSKNFTKIQHNRY